MVLILRIVVISLVLLFSLIGSTEREVTPPLQDYPMSIEYERGHRERMRQLKQEIHQELQKRNIRKIPIRMQEDGSIWKISTYSREDTLQKFLTALKNVKHLDTSFFDVDSILIATQWHSRKGDLECAQAVNKKFYIYIPNVRDEKHMIQAMSTTPDDEPYIKVAEKREHVEKNIRSSKTLDKDTVVKSLLREIKMECHYRSPPIQIEVSSCERNQNHLCISSGWCVDSRGENISFPSITCWVGTGNECPDAKLCLLGKGSAYLDSEVLTEMPYKLPKKLVPDTIFDKAVQ